MVVRGEGDDDDTTESGFCDNFQTVTDGLTKSGNATPDELQDQLDNLAQIDPSDQIADAYQNLIDAYQAATDAEALTDPAIAAELSQAQANLTEIETYIADNCTP